MYLQHVMKVKCAAGTQSVHFPKKLRYNTRIMKSIKTIVPLIICLLLSAAVAHASEGDAIVGSWNTAGRDAIIDIYRCGERYCGKIKWLREPNYTAEDKNGKEGQPKIDSNNPNPRLRNRTLVGLELMHDFVYAGNNLWKGGNIYDPERGKTYSALMRLAARNSLHLKGYIGIPLLGRTSVWTRAGS
jgi:uncharacterized protein (DUF2147 family)